MSRSEYKYKSLVELNKAYMLGELRFDENVVDVDNDTVSLWIDHTDSLPECVYRYEGRLSVLLIEALALVGIPAEPV